MKINSIKDLRELFDKYDLPGEQKEKYVADFLEVVLSNVITKAAEEKLSGEEKGSFDGYLKDGKIDEAVNLIKGKCSGQEWEDLFSQTVQPLAESYIKEVIER